MRTTPARIAPLAALGVLAWLLAATVPAAAGTYDVVACRAASAPPGQPAPSGAFTDFGHLGIPTKGMTMFRGCAEAGGRVSGLVAENTRTGRRVRRGRQAGFYLAAPDQTTISHLWWSGKIWRRDCRYSVGTYAVGTGGPLRTIENRQAGRTCPWRERRGGRTKVFLATATVGRPDVPKPFPMPPGVTGIVQRVACVGGPNGFCTDRSLNRIVTWYARVTINDPHPPTASIVQDNAFAQGAWTSNSSQSVGYTANDPYGGGIKTAQIPGVQSADDVAACDNTQTVPCAQQRTGRIGGIETGQLPEGTQQLVVRAVDAADNPGDSAPVTVRIDRTAPGAPAVSVEGGDGWTSTNLFTATWQNPDEGDRAPITAAHWRLCRPDGSSCTTGSQTGTGIARLADLKVPDQGEWDLRVSRQDAAGNHNTDYASQPVRLRLDQERPALSFEPRAPEDPTRVSVAVTEKISGIASAQMEISAAGSNTWQGLPAKLEGNRLVAHIADDALVPGQYLVRAQAADLAGNVGVATAPQPLTLPLRIQSVLQAGVVTTRIVRDQVEAKKGKKGRRGRRGSRRRTVRRRMIELRPESRVRFGGHATIAGRLTNRDGQGLPGQQIRVLGPGAGGEELLALLTTDTQGGFSYRAGGSASRTLRFVHAGTPTVLPAESRVTLVVPAAGSFKVSRKRLPNGRSVVFRGRVASLPLPPAGKLVELQVYYGRKQGWRTFRTMRTDAQGQWAMRYRFQNTECHTTYRLRARIPTEAGYPFAQGHSRTRKVRVLGAEGRCP